uniref:Uncharacterized protein n=1 Tax=Anguilla anguilla TaxID=7936 RepID=A0A0E9R144_ANGAN
MNKLPFYTLASTLHILQETTSTLQRGSNLSLMTGSLLSVIITLTQRTLVALSPPYPVFMNGKLVCSLY